MRLQAVASEGVADLFVADVCERRVLSGVASASTEIQDSAVDSVPPDTHSRLSAVSGAWAHAKHTQTHTWHTQ